MEKSNWEDQEELEEEEEEEEEEEDLRRHVACTSNMRNMEETIWRVCRSVITPTY
jgi:hypothetical protein